MGILTRSAKQAAMLSAIISALLAGIVYLLGYPEFSRGLLIGMLAGVGFFYIMWRQLKQTMAIDDVKEAVAELKSGWVERTLYTVVVCLGAYFAPGVHFAGVLIGLLALHGVVVIWGGISLVKINKQGEGK
jgi:MFS superfamily sulfate permease-like transporter